MIIQKNKKNILKNIISNLTFEKEKKQNISDRLNSEIDKINISIMHKKEILDDYKDTYKYLINKKIIKHSFIYIIPIWLIYFVSILMFKNYGFGISFGFSTFFALGIFATNISLMKFFIKKKMESLFFNKYSNVKELYNSILDMEKQIKFNEIDINDKKMQLNNLIENIKHINNLICLKQFELELVNEENIDYTVNENTSRQEIVNIKKRVRLPKKM